MKFNNSKCMVSRICLIKLFDLNMSSVSVCSVSGFHKKEMGQVKVPCDVFTIIPVFLSFFFGATGRSTAFSLSKREQNDPDCTKRGHFFIILRAASSYYP
jgi:hypothetical protein